jgi:lysine-ketoglutarate reductase/saccharopine dehydrogenase-like protein (TIGR00300 family)
MMNNPKPSLVMCRPTHFGVQYEINPWMQGQIGLARNRVAREQWDRLHDILSGLTDVTVIEGADSLPDMCFVANAGLVLGNRFIPSVFRFPQREPEAPLFREWFRQAGYELVELPDDETFEGEGDALLASDPPDGQAPWLWAGYGIRSSLESYREITEKLGIEVVPLRLTDERFYHLDTCLCALPGGRVFYYPPAFDKVSLNEIEQRVPPERRIEVGEIDAVRFACNAVRVGRTLVTNAASRELQAALARWEYEVVTTPLDEFMLAGGAAKCLCLMGNQAFATPPDRRIETPIRQTHVQLRGHLLDSGLMNRVFDAITDGGGTFRVEQFVVGLRHDEPSTSTVRVTAPTSERLDLITNQLQSLGAEIASEPIDARLEPVARDGVAPQTFYSTTIYPTDVRMGGEWIRVTAQRMDAVIVAERPNDSPAARCSLIRDLKEGDRVVCGVEGVRVKRPLIRQGDRQFAFMSSGVSSERRVELAVEKLAWEMRRIRARGGRIVFVAGPVVIHTGGGTHLSEIIRMGYIDALLTGNALPTHDIEMNLFGTSLGVDLARGVGVEGGHQHHIKAINRIRAAGSIRAAVESGVLTGGVMHACVKHGVDYVLAGSIRDDGPLPDTIMDLYQAQAAYARAIEGADMIVMLSSMLHAIGTGNMTPAGVQLVCVDISPSVVTKLADRGSVESTGIVTDVGLFLNLLSRQLSATAGAGANVGENT